MASTTLRERFLKSFAYYRDWHLANRNPAFVPWHTQAYCQYLRLHPADDIQAFVFEMNDWLITVQQEKNVPLDCVGRFYAPNKRYGPPHASATGVYLEGLVDACQLARSAGDAKRYWKYLRSIKLGLRSVQQLTFSNSTDMFYISQKHRVAGGVRTTFYDNRIRVDNVQHCLLAIQKVLADAAFASDLEILSI
ncbi:hypothetical protein Poly51_26480 [Rubripirellula tenax]|uniref:Uncharacterized protein n=1 Tax=Rubripirellula tenax TaxID=2528015 RepID=A0A5C6FAX8_9BACT|nr:hypothetical protein [Rubripirellula tenax]TWU56731.1 hypothetical protein Poly51_26480 [Rubripirellula tenax]